MQNINRPPPKEDPPPLSYKGGNVPHVVWKNECVPHTLGVTLTVAIITLDIISDWLAWRTFITFDFSRLIQESLEKNNTHSSYWGLDNLYLKLPVIYFAICIASSIIYLLEIIRLVCELVRQRRKVTEHLDGIQYKGPAVERYCRDLMLILQVVIEDLMLTLILLACQAVISCSFVIPINSAIFVLSAGATCASLIWKLGQVTWRSGCMGQRADYQCNVVQALLRITSFILIVATLSVVVLNLVLLTNPGKQKTQPRNALLDKLGIDRWLDQDDIVLSLQLVQYPTDNNNASGTLNNSPGLTKSFVFHGKDQNYLEFTNVIKLKEIIEAMPAVENHTFARPCDDLGNFFQPFLQPKHQMHYSNREHWDCSVVFRFLYSPLSMTVLCNVMYRFQNLYDTSQCEAHSFRSILSTEEYSTLSKQHQPTEIETFVTSDSSGSSTIYPQPGNIQRSLTVKPVTMTTEVVLRVTTSPAKHITWLKCAFQFIPDAESLKISPCDPNDLPEMLIS